ncbi:hypothetical protein Cs7R123_01320 [Catellatospora sp. TT07R-123]|uniref:hypothetical protein n=1 Tax=Catellatospora sp. TT07R-123 TaxID=2733863 RepID=UPI001B1568B9|nr:hypothetical protein [Catellatospora sp. TT07R-123]GHJ42790.1 hypothetical protein Cs7R123_01320 [Catellatospora sp. TT07R-123]
MPLPRLRPALLACVLLTGGCSAFALDSSSRPDSRTTMPAELTTVAAGTSGVELALQASRSLFRQAPAVVLVGEQDQGSMEQAGATAIDLGVPLLVTATGDGAAPDVRAELDRLAPRTLIPVGDAATGWAREHKAGKEEVKPLAEGKPSRPAAAAALDKLFVLTVNRAQSAAATATAKASGAHVLELPEADPRADDAAIKALSGQAGAPVLALGSDFGTADQLRNRIETAATGTLLPGGRQVLFPHRRLIALYGHPGDAGLGSLGEQPVDRAIARAQKVAAQYASVVGDTVVPAFEIIATVASADPGPDGDYSNESTAAELRPWIDAARTAGVYVVLDLQPGRTDFLTQAKLYEELLLQPHVGLALDPEWRLTPHQVHMVQIGSVASNEINKTAAWLAELTRSHHLPQKILMLHQFRTDMISDRSDLDTSFDELSVVIHADGFGSAGEKMATWENVHLDAPSRIWWGWKNFYDEDHPTFSPRQTMEIEPKPVFVSYQ